MPERYVEAPIDLDYRAHSKGFGLLFYLKWGVVFVLLIFSVLMGLIVSKTTSQLPDIKILEDYRPSETTQIFDRNGLLVANIHGDEDRVVVPLRDISPNVRKALMAIEDNRFYEHNGIDPRGMLRAFVTNSGADSNVQGGSTITQQLVKNLFLTPEKSYTRKLAEAILAIRVEKRYSKDKILEMYLNQVYFGNQSYGIEKAARRYFKKSAKDLSLSEGAMVAGLLKAPEGLSPYYFPEAANKRRIQVLSKMVEYGYITAKQRDLASREKLVLNSRAAKPSKHPYFVAYVIQELQKRFGEDVLRRGGLKVYTTMDEKMQNAAEKALEHAILSAKGSGIQQGAFVGLDTESGEVLSLVGGIGFEKNQFNSATMGRRAVGSTFKPFVYLTGFRLGRVFPRTPISDRPICFGSWCPHNWDGRYMGSMDIRKALTLSRNTPTVQVGMKVGIEEVIKTAKLAGIQSPIDPNSSSLLGSSGVSPLELVTGYSTLARGGVYIEPTALKRVYDSRGKLVNVEMESPKRVFEQDFVAAVVDIMIDVVEKGTGKGAKLDKHVVAGKTGTTDQVRDIWFMGFTPEVVGGVWMGNKRNIPLHGVFSSNSAKVWHEVVSAYYIAHPTPPQSFFKASAAYAAKAGIIHLVNEKDKSAKASKFDTTAEIEFEGVLPVQAMKPDNKVSKTTTEVKPNLPLPLIERLPLRHGTEEEGPLAPPEPAN
jgi:penicillin-binding protein 1A